MLYFFIWPIAYLYSLQMIESSARGDEYEGVMYSQLVCCSAPNNHSVYTFQLPMDFYLIFCAFVIF